MESLVTIIMPIYNASKYLNLSIESVLKQSYKNFTLLLIDDGSTDNSIEIIQEYKKKDDRIIVINKENGGVCNARNIGLKMTKTKYVTFIDHDDEYDKDFLKNILMLIESKELDLVKCSRKNVFIDLNGLSLGYNECNYSDSIYESKDLYKNILSICKSEIWGSVWNGIYKTSLFKENKLIFNENYKNGNEDIDISVDLLFKANKVGIISYIGYYHYYRIGQSTSMKFNEKQITSRLEVINKEIDYLKVNNLEKYKDEFLAYHLLDYFKILFFAFDLQMQRKYINIISDKIDIKSILSVNLMKKVKKMSRKNYIEFLLIRSRYPMIYFFFRNIFYKIKR